MATMRALQSLDINLGLFGFSVKIYKAIEDPSEAISFRQLHRACNSPINAPKVCHKCGDGTHPAIVPMSDIVKGFEYQPNQFVLVADDEIKALRPVRDAQVKINGYVDANEIDAAYLEGTVYYLAPGGKDSTTFVTWRDALGNKCAMGTVVMYGRERVVAIKAHDRMLALYFVRTKAEVRSTEDVPGYNAIPVVSQQAHRDLMAQVIDTQMVSFDDVTVESDRYVNAVRSLIDSKISGQPLVETEAPAAIPSAMDLIAAMKATLAQKGLAVAS